MTVTTKNNLSLKNFENGAGCHWSMPVCEESSPPFAVTAPEERLFFVSQYPRPVKAVIFKRGQEL